MRWWIGIFGIILSLIIIFLITLPYGLEWYIEKHDQELIGREITLDKVDLNLFNGHLTLKGVTLYEANQQDTFFRADRLGVSMAWLSLFKNKIHLREVVADAPYLQILQRGRSLNFDDLITQAKSVEEDTSVAASLDYTWQLDTLCVQRGKLLYVDELVNSRLILDSLLIISSGASSQRPLIPTIINFQSGTGRWENHLNLDLNRKTYALQSQIVNWSLAPFTPYFTRHLKVSEFDSNLEALFSLAGSYQKTDSIAFRGTIGLNNLRFMNLEQDSLLAWNALNITIDSTNTASRHYDFGNIKLDKPYLYFELTEEGENITRKPDLSKADSVVQQELQDSTEFTSPFEYLALYLYDITQAYLSANYVADTILVSHGTLDYLDQTLSEPFHMQLSEFSALATDITREDQYANFYISSKVNQSGELFGNLDISRRGIDDMILDFRVQNLSVEDFNPYSLYYMGHPLHSGNLFFISKSTIKDYYLQSDNNLYVGNIEVGDKMNNEAVYNVPMKLAVALLKDNKGHVDLKIPVDGDLNDPNYHLGSIILQVLVNDLVKVATSPYRFFANLLGGREQDLKSISFAPLSSQLENAQKRKLRQIIRLLNEKPDVKVFFEYAVDNIREEEIIALSEAKKASGLNHHVSARDSSWLLQTQLTENDSLFIQFLQTSLPTIDTVSEDNLIESCRNFIGESTIDSLSALLLKQRQVVINDFFIQSEKLPDDRWAFRALETQSEDTSFASGFHLKYELQ